MTIHRHNSKSLVVTLGDPGGIGPELLFDIWLNRHNNHVSPFLYLAEETFVAERAKQLGLTIPTIQWQTCAKDRCLTTLFQDFLPVYSLGETIVPTLGKSTVSNAPATLKSIETAVTLIRQNQASAMVTCPINKKSLYDAGFQHPGHTEYLGALATEWDEAPFYPIMMLAGPELKTIPATLHIPLQAVPDALRRVDLIRLIQTTNQSLKQYFGVEHPQIAVAGLNPHAGEEGSMGVEDEEVIRPAILKAQEKGIGVQGPFPADTLFYRDRRKSYDVVIAMYHDQALIPVKTIAFDETVNITLGLPFIRTSPDHGTAFDIAGKGIARSNSLLAAIKMAAEMASNDR